MSYKCPKWSYPNYNPTCSQLTKSPAPSSSLKFPDSRAGFTRHKDMTLRVYRFKVRGVVGTGALQFKVWGLGFQS